MNISEQYVTTPNGHGASFSCRDGTVDANIAIGLNVWMPQGSDPVVGDEYRMKGRNLSGWAIDVGAHIGAWSIAAALDNPALRVLAIEVVPESAALAALNAKRNRVDDRVTVIEAAAASPRDATVQCHWGYRGNSAVSEGYASAHRLIAGTWGDREDPEFNPAVAAVNLDTLMAEHGIDEIALLKIDCEGCEWAFLDTDLSRVQTIVGEYHGGVTGIEDTKARLGALLDATHDITYWREEPVIGTFEAVRRG